MHSVVFNVFLLLVLLPIVASAQEKPIVDSGFARANSNDVRDGVNFGKQFGGGVILTPSGVVVTCKHVIAGFSEIHFHESEWVRNPTSVRCLNAVYFRNSTAD
jgi:S1-C subfamily serine protease